MKTINCKANKAVLQLIGLRFCKQILEIIRSRVSIQVVGIIEVQNTQVSILELDFQCKDIQLSLVHTDRTSIDVMVRTSIDVLLGRRQRVDRQVHQYCLNQLPLVSSNTGSNELVLVQNLPPQLSTILSTRFQLGTLEHMH